MRDGQAIAEDYAITERASTDDLPDIDGSDAVLAMSHRVSHMAAAGDPGREAQVEQILWLYFPAILGLIWIQDQIPTWVPGPGSVSSPNEDRQRTVMRRQWARAGYQPRMASSQPL